MECSWTGLSDQEAVLLDSVQTKHTPPLQNGCQISDSIFNVPNKELGLCKTFYTVKMAFYIYIIV